MMSSPKGAAWESPARQCRVEVGRWNESRRDGTSSERLAALRWTAEAAVPTQAPRWYHSLLTS